MNKRRILIFNDGLELGGTEKLLIDLLNHLSKKECQLTLLLPMPSVNNVLLPQVPEMVSIKYLYTGNESRLSRKWNEIKMIFRTHSFLKQHDIVGGDYDQVICFKECFYAKMFSDFSITKTLWIHNILYRREYQIRSLKEKASVWLNKKQVKIVQKSYTQYNKVVCVSEACKQSYIEVVCEGLPPNQDIRVVFNAIDFEKVKERSLQAPEFEMSESETNFVLLTRLSIDKRIDRIIEATYRLVSEGYTSFRIHIFGVDADEESLVGQIEEKGLRNTISIHGVVDNPYPYIKQADWLLCVSERESFSLSLLEAMSLGVPVITTDCGGPAEIVGYGKDGILVDNSTDGVYTGLKSVLEDKTLVEKYTKPLEQVVKKYDYKKWLTEVDRLLDIN